MGKKRKKGLASRNIVHPQKIILHIRCVGFCFCILDKISYEFQGLSSTDCNFQGLSRPWIFIFRFKDFQGLSRRVRTLFTVPFNVSLTVSTQNWILDPLNFSESRIKFRGSSFEFWGLSFEFWDTPKKFFWGSWTEILRKRLNSRKQNNSDEQNWR